MCLFSLFANICFVKCKRNKRCICIAVAGLKKILSLNMLNAMCLNYVLYLNDLSKGQWARNSLKNAYSFRIVSAFQCISTLLGTNRQFSCLSHTGLWMHPGCLLSLGNCTDQSVFGALVKFSWLDSEHLVLNVKKGISTQCESLLLINTELRQA